VTIGRRRSAAGGNPEPVDGRHRAGDGQGTTQPGSDSAAAAVADAHRREWAFVLAATARVAGDIDLAEECVQDAYVAALDAWSRHGVPRNPGAWLTTAARRRAIDALRRDKTLRGKLPLLVEPAPPVAGSTPPAPAPGEDDVIPDDRLRLVFTCCHPALAREAQVALTLRLVCGLTTTEIAQAFLVPEPTMAARVTRAKKKISAARIAYRVPGLTCSTPPATPRRPVRTWSAPISLSAPWTWRGCCSRSCPTNARCAGCSPCCC
jgi:RNA polymerase sigma factor (sigma-70 family)